MNFKEIIDLLRSDGSVIVNKRLIRAIGLKEAILYSELVSKAAYFNEKKKLTPDGFFFNTSENLRKDTGLTEYSQNQAIRNLKELGLIDYSLQGLPATKHFKIAADKKKLQQIMDTPKQVSEKDVGHDQKKANTLSLDYVLEMLSSGHKDWVEFQNTYVLLVYFKTMQEKKIEQGEKIGVNEYSKTMWFNMLKDFQNYNMILIDTYFATKYKVPYNFAHFMNPEIQKYLWEQIR